MSYRIDYRYALFSVAPEICACDELRYVLAVECGSNNCWERDPPRRARSWQVEVIGTASQVLKHSVRLAGACEGGLLQPRGRGCTPEAYIGRIRRLLTEQPAPQGVQWRALLRVSTTHPAAAFAASRGVPTVPRMTDGAYLAIAEFSRQALPVFFEIVERFPDLPPERLAQVWHAPG